MIAKIIRDYQRDYYVNQYRLRANAIVMAINRSLNAGYDWISSSSQK